MTTKFVLFCSAIFILKTNLFNSGMRLISDKLSVVTNNK